MESLALAIPFALSHNFEGADRFPVGTPAAPQPVDWYKSQVRRAGRGARGPRIAGTLRRRRRGGRGSARRASVRVHFPLRAFLCVRACARACVFACACACACAFDVRAAQVETSSTYGGFVRDERYGTLL